MATTTLLPLSLLVIQMVGIVNSEIINDQDFIKSSCNATMYPVRCVESLSSNASAIGNSEQQLAIVALSVSLSTAQLLASSIKKLGSAASTTRMKHLDKNTVQDCIQLTDNSVEHLTNSITELGLVGKPNEKESVHIKNVLTWLSSASTAQSTCLDELNEASVDAKLKDDIGRGVSDVYELISIALSLVARYASKFPKTNS